MYILQDGTQVTAQQIREAFETGKALIVHGRDDNHSSASLMLDGKPQDTRGECYSMWDEVWTQAPASLQEAMRVAYYNPNP